MSTPDYDQFAEDHQGLLIVIKQIGPQMNPSLFNQIYDRLTQLYEFKITDNKGMGFERTVRLLYKQSYSIENNDWGDFQAHRRLVGLITIARSFNDNEIESIQELHNTIRDTYANTLFDSRCFVIRSPGTSEHLTAEETEQTELGNNENELNSSPTPTSQSSPIPLADNSNAQPEEQDHLFDFHLGEPLFMSSGTSDHNAFSSHVNRSSSSESSLSSSSSHFSPMSPTSQSPNHNSSNNGHTTTSHQPLQAKDSTTQPNSLPSTATFASTTSNDSASDHNSNRSRTHSRNKSLDSHLFSPTSILDSQPSSATLQSSMLMRSASGENLSHQQQNHYQAQQSLHSPASSSTNEYVRYESDEQCCAQIEARLKDFITGLFWVLESKRLDRASEKMDKIPLLMAPFEKKDLIGLDTDTRSFRRKCMGRMRKHIADLSLLAGLPQEALTNYMSAIEQLKAVNDKLWLAAAYEGLCSSSLALLYPDRWHQIHKLRRQFHFDHSLYQNLISRSDYEAARCEVGNWMRRVADKETLDDASQQRTSAATANKNILTIDQFYDRYKEAASHYALYRGAAILEFECSFKAARTLIFFGRYLRASDFIQNAVFITFTQSTEDQIERLLQISKLYENIRFYRKAAFYKRFAALKSVSLHIKSPNWEKCYFLLLPALFDYGVTLDPTEYDRRLERNEIAWSGIHVQLIQEMITTSLKMANETLAMRHLTFMLQCLFNHISPSQRQEFATKLSSLASKCGEGSPVQLKLSNGAIIPSVNFTKFPTVIYFKVEPLAPYLRPVKLKLKSGKEQPVVHDSGPFIYTPLQLNRTPRNLVNTSKTASGDSVTKVTFYWTEGNMGRITLNLHNFLPIEMNISSVTVMTDGVAFEPNHDTALKIAANTSYPNISLTGIPRASGTLEILGYRIHALGIKSDCRLAQLPNARKLKLPGRFAVEVVPRLPLMCAQCFGAQADMDQIRATKGLSAPSDIFKDIHISTSAYISLYTGQRKSYQLWLSNISRNADELIDFVDMEVIYPKHISPQLQKLIKVEWSTDEITNALPIGRDMHSTFNITISVGGDFVYRPANKMPQLPTGSDKSETNSNKSGKKPQVLGSSKLASLLNELQTKKSTNEQQQQLSSTSAANSLQYSYKGPGDFEETEFPKEIFDSKIVEFCLRLDYSGGPGLNSGFCRQTAIYFVVEVQPSVLITHWDVLSAEQPDECYLVFDALNATDHELTLLYATNKEMLIESREKCRIPVPIKRCPLNVTESLEEEEDEDAQIYRRRRDLANKARQPQTSSKSADFLSYIFPTEQGLKAILRRSRHHLLDQIELKWKLLAVTGAATDAEPQPQELEGTVSVDNVPYSNEMLKSLLIPPIQSEIEINSITFRSSQGEVVAKVGDRVAIQTRLVNTSEASLESLRLYLFCYQDYQNPAMMTTGPSSNHKTTRNYNLINTKMIISGCDSLCLEQLASKASHSHNCGLVFLYCGVYKLEICCLPEESFQRLRLESRTWPDIWSTGAGSGQTSLFTCLHTVEITVEE